MAHHNELSLTASDWPKARADVLSWRYNGCLLNHESKPQKPGQVYYTEYNGCLLNHAGHHSTTVHTHKSCCSCVRLSSPLQAETDTTLTHPVCSSFLFALQAEPDGGTTPHAAPRHDVLTALAGAALSVPPPALHSAWVRESMELPSWVVAGGGGGGAGGAERSGRTGRDLDVSIDGGARVRSGRGG